jgi:tRNA threonylcarbamoyl adenosine modification protein (Sua5/YciO/YrdC/YwlC family)
MTQNIQQACQILHSGGVIAYATEAVFGLGCDPDNEAAVHKLLQIKQRPIEKGLILIAAEWQQLTPYLDISSLSDEQLQRVLDSWPGPYTWVFPAKTTTPKWLTGQFSSLAVRVSTHPQVRALCQLYGKPLVSTSANLTSLPACRTEHEVRLQLGERIGFILPGDVGTNSNPSEIRDVMTNQLLRAG